MKKNYIVPATEVVEVELKERLLVGSGDAFVDYTGDEADNGLGALSNRKRQSLWDETW